MEQEKKTVSVVVPIFNEQENIRELYNRVSAVFASVTKYDYEIVFFDDGSTDNSVEMIRDLCREDNRVKGVFYARNFGYSKNVFYAMQQAKGNCAILLHADLQNPPEEIPHLLEHWEKGAKIVLGVKNKSRENKFLFFIRSMFYAIMNFVFRAGIIPHATEFELFDESFIQVLRSVHLRHPYLRAIVMEYGWDLQKHYYVQDQRKKGKTKFNLSKYYDFAVCGLVNMSSNLPRWIMGFGVVGILATLVEFFAHFLPKILLPGLAGASDWYLRGIFLFLCINAVLFALVGEYVLSAHKNTQDVPLVIEKQRIDY